MGQRHKISNARTTSYLTSNCLSYLKTIFIAFLFKCFFWKETLSDYSYNKLVNFIILQWMSFLNWQRFWDSIYMKWYLVLHRTPITSITFVASSYHLSQILCMISEFYSHKMSASKGSINHQTGNIGQHWKCNFFFH